LFSSLLKDVASANVMYHFMTKLLSLRRDNIIQKWLKGDEFGSKLVTFTETLCEESLQSCDEEADDLTSSWSLLSLALTTEDNFGKILFRSKGISSSSASVVYFNTTPFYPRHILCQPS
jgi:hypothetical protein